MLIKDVPAMRVLSAARRLSIRQIGSVSSGLTGRIEADAKRCGLEVTGPWTFIARNSAAGWQDRIQHPLLPAGCGDAAPG